jgi:hypothetical protein
LTGTHFIEEATGKVIQGGATKHPEYVFRGIPADTLEGSKNTLVARYRGEGWAPVTGVIITGCPGAQVWAIGRERFDALQALRHKSHEPASGPDGNDAMRIKSTVRKTKVQVNPE